MHHLGNSEISCGRSRKKRKNEKKKETTKFEGVLCAIFFFMCITLAIAKSAATTQNFRV
jgi:preprotein translocase subunit SecG